MEPVEIKTADIAGTLCKARRADNGKWVEGAYFKHQKVIPSPIGKDPANNDYAHLIVQSGFADWNMPRPITCIEIIPETVSPFTGKLDKDGRKIFKGDITELILPDGETRHLIADIRTVVRTVVSHPDFDDDTAKVEISGLVFLWNGYELFPCIDSDGISDICRMKVIGHIHDEDGPAWIQ